MNRIEKKLLELNPALHSLFCKTREDVKLLLQKYQLNFPTYTDHSLEHSSEVFNIVDEILDVAEIDNLNDDELYILSMSCYLHDIGMCFQNQKLKILVKQKNS